MDVFSPLCALKTIARATSGEPDRINKNIKEKIMYEYKIETYKVRKAQVAMNKLAREGWRVIAVSPNMGIGYGIVVTYERKK